MGQPQANPSTRCNAGCCLPYNKGYRLYRFNKVGKAGARLPAPRVGLLKAWLPITLALTLPSVYKTPNGLYKRGVGGLKA